MAESDSTPAGDAVSDDDLTPFERRAFAEIAPLLPATPDEIGTTPEALTILREQGVEAWRAYCAEQDPTEQAPPEPDPTNRAQSLVSGGAVSRETCGHDHDSIHGDGTFGEHAELLALFGELRPDIANVDLQPVADAWAAALAKVMDKWTAVTAGWRNKLRPQIVDAIDDNDLPRLAELVVDTADAAGTLTEALEALAAVAATQMVVEAAADVVLTAVTPPGLGVVGEVVAALLGQDMATAAGREALRINTPESTGATVAGDVDVMLRERSTASTEAAVGGALTGAQNAARIETMLSGPVGSVYADETLDGNTCAPCRAINGRFICTTEDIGPYSRLYTAMGGYVGCLGRERCRGTVTGVWRPQTTEENDS